MSDWEIYQEWLASPWVDEETKEELRAISDQPREIEERFYKPLEFGTGGVRGLLGAGRNRMNRYTIRRITQGLSDYIHTLGEEALQKGVVIAYDCRHQSRDFALETALTLQMNQITAYLFESFCPTPLLSFAVRELKAMGGVVITASHNPPEYNGYKVYWEDGGQIIPSLAQEMMEKIALVEEILPLPQTGSIENPIQWVGKELSDSYIARLKEVCFQREVDLSLKVVYTPLHGVGNELVQRVLREFGFTQVDTVSEQEQPDPHFHTVTSPNPEEKEALQMAMVLAEWKKADLIIATDPDADRMGVEVRNSAGEYQFLTGNQVGALLLYDQLSERARRGTLPSDAVVVKTMVAGEMGKAIAHHYGVEMMETHTGFKYIAAQIRQLEEVGEKTFLFGYEESCGYLAGTFVRDKDGIMATLLLCQMAAYYRTLNRTLVDVLEQLYAEYGTFLEALESRTFPGKEGGCHIQSIMSHWRTARPQHIGFQEIIQVCDFEKQESSDVRSGTLSPLALPKANVLRFTLDDGSWFCLRPSGTEPKMKVYFSVRGKTHEEARRCLDRLVTNVMQEIDSWRWML